MIHLVPLTLPWITRAKKHSFFRTSIFRPTQRLEFNIFLGVFGINRSGMSSICSEIGALQRQIPLRGSKNFQTSKNDDFSKKSVYWRLMVTHSILESWNLAEKLVRPIATTSIRKFFLKVSQSPTVMHQKFFKSHFFQKLKLTFLGHNTLKPKLFWFFSSFYN